MNRDQKINTLKAVLKGEKDVSAFIGNVFIDNNTGSFKSLENGKNYTEDHISTIPGTVFIIPDNHRDQ